MSLSLWPPNPLPPVDVLILIVAVVGIVLAVRKFFYDMRHPPGSATPIVADAPQSTAPPSNASA